MPLEGYNRKRGMGHTYPTEKPTIGTLIVLCASPRDAPNEDFPVVRWSEANARKYRSGFVWWYASSPVHIIPWSIIFWMCVGGGITWFLMR